MKLKGYVFGILVICIVSGLQDAVAGEKWRMILDLEGRWVFSIGDNKKWALPHYNDSHWERIDVPSKWEDEGFYGYDGFAWYRKSFDGTLLKSKTDTYNLFLGYIDDVDEVYFNGHKIGSSGSFPPRYHTAFNALRNYYIPNAYINFEGKNVIAVRVYDAEIEGGIVSGDVGIFVNDDDRGLALNLRGIWDFSLSSKRYNNFHEEKFSPRTNRRPPEEANWIKLSVPGVWENQGYPNYDGSAWYRKQFTLPKELNGHDLVLVLGKIDDIDEVYINGKFVGSSRQYDQLRFYNIPAGEVIPGAVNLLLVYVDDTGGLGGIYEGPVGLIKQSELTRYVRWRD